MAYQLAQEITVVKTKRICLDLTQQTTTNPTAKVIFFRSHSDNRPKYMSRPLGIPCGRGSAIYLSKASQVSVNGTLKACSETRIHNLSPAPIGRPSHVATLFHVRNSHLFHAFLLSFHSSLCFHSECDATITKQCDARHQPNPVPSSTVTRTRLGKCNITSSGSARFRLRGCDCIFGPRTVRFVFDSPLISDCCECE